MAYENLVILIGYLGADPELRYMPDGSPVVQMRVATTKHYKDKEGEKQEHTEWHRVVGFGQIANFAGEYSEKGNLVYVRGDLRTRKWQDKDGVDRYSTEIICRNFQLLSGKRQGDSAESGGDEIPVDTRLPDAEDPQQEVDSGKARGKKK